MNPNFIIFIQKNAFENVVCQNDGHFVQGRWVNRFITASHCNSKLSKVSPKCMLGGYMPLWRKGLNLGTTKYNCKAPCYITDRWYLRTSFKDGGKSLLEFLIISIIRIGPFWPRTISSTLCSHEKGAYSGAGCLFSRWWSDVLHQSRMRSGQHEFNTLRPLWNGRHFPDDIFKCIFLNGNVWISIKISLKFIPRGPINNMPALVQIMAWRRPGDKPLSEPMMVNLMRHICVTHPQWVELDAVKSRLPLLIFSKWLR